MEDTDYLIGIDLGTTNSSVACIHRKARGRRKTAVDLFPIPQLVKPGALEERNTLPSFLYLAGEFDLPAGSIALPWDKDRDFAVGHFARIQGERVPSRLVHSAKSWLCHAGVDRYASILPWGESEGIEKISPVDASARYLSFMRESWNHFKAQNIRELFEAQSIVLTVPAAFDEVARNLTVEAARRAGLENLVLLEEPMAAFYYWIYSHHQRWPKEVKGDMLALVCDIGGGTTDFSLIEVTTYGEELEFKRVAVGDHLLLGGDNMDLAVALHLEQTQAKKKLAPSQFVQLVGQCRHAKENLWQQEPDGECEFTIAGTGSSLIGGAIKFKLRMELFHEIIAEGFFPIVSWEEKEERARRPGFKEWGLPYESEPAITRHLLYFLKRHLPQGKRPDLILFNGGVLIPPVIRQKILSQISLWFSGPEESWKPIELVNERLDLAVAYGAAYFHLVRLGKGIRIAGGSPRSFFLELRSNITEEGAKAICLLPFGAREGEVFKIEQHPLELLAEQPVSFPLYSSTIRKSAVPGDIVEISEDMVRLLPVHATLKVGKTARRHVPVQMQAELSEIGTLDINLMARDSDRRWRLQFQIRSIPVKHEAKPLDFPLEEIKKILAGTFSKGQNPSPETLPRHLEETLRQKRDSWNLTASRKIVDLLLECTPMRTLSSIHETRWLNLVGFCLRPGVGASGDDWRVRRIWSLAQEKIHYEKEIQNRVEWWVLWRRIAAGLNSFQQMDVFRQVSYHLLPKSSRWRSKKTAQKHVKALELAEMWRAAASMENLPMELRCELAEHLAQKAGDGLEDHEFWALGRLGARVPFYGQNAIPPDKVVPWILTILQAKEDTPARFYALAQMTRKTGDRAMDIEESLRIQVLQILKERCPHLYQMVAEVIALDSDLQKHYFGDSFPPGLTIDSRV